MTRLCLWVVGLVLVPTLGFGQPVIFRTDVQPGIQGVAPPMPPGMPPRDPTQPAKTGTATLRGHVVAADTGQPLRKAQYLHALGWINLKSGNRDQARQDFTQALALDPGLQGAKLLRVSPCRLSLWSGLQADTFQGAAGRQDAIRNAISSLEF